MCLPFDLESSNRIPFMKEDKSKNDGRSRRPPAREPTANTTASLRFHLSNGTDYNHSCMTRGG